MKIIQVDLNKDFSVVIEVGILPRSKPSTVLDLASDEPKILRVGPSRPDQLMKLLENMPL